MSEVIDIDKILECFGFNDSSQRTIVAGDGFESYDEILTLGDSDIMNLADGLSDSTVAAGKIGFGLRRANLLKETIHWAQDLRRISRTPSQIRIRNADEFCAVIGASKQRDRIRKHSLD